MSAVDEIRPGTAANRVAAVMIRHWYAARRSPHRLLDIVFWPVFDLVLYGSIAVYVRGTGDSSGAERAVVSVVAGLIMWQVMYQAHSAVSMGFFEEIYARQLPSLLTTPLRPVEWLLGVALQGLVKVALAITAVSGAAAIMYHFNVTAAGPPVVAVMALLLLTGWSISMVVMGVVLYLGSGTETLAWSLLFSLLPLSGAFYPVSVLPAAIRPVSAALPTTYVFGAARAVMTGEAAPWDEIGLAALAVAGLMAATLTFAVFALRAFQRRGTISRYA